MNTLQADCIRSVKASQRSLRATLAFLKAVENQLERGGRDDR